MLKRFLINLWGGKHLGWRIARVLFPVIVGVLAYVMAFESSFIYFPAKYPEGDWQMAEPRVVEDRVVARIEDVQLTARDGTRIHGWYCTPHIGRGGALEAVETDRALLYLHGNGGNVTHRRDIIDLLVGLPVNVLIIDYRGYGKSEGTPSEEGLYEDARAAWDYLTNARGVRASRIVIYGESLGGAVAVDLASKVKPCGLVVQSSFTSIADMAAELMPLVPHFVIRTKMDSREKIA
ncbi:MAG: alpha/beta hydrolase, partial [Pyrinomonadaceae bacterium]